MKECLDTSVIVKWFKEGEQNEKEADLLKDKIVSFEIDVIINEWLQLELVRAMVKNGFSKNMISDALDYFEGLIENYSVRLIKVSEIKELAQRLQIEHSLHTGDAVHLATAIYTSSNTFWADDKHFIKPEIIEMASKHGVAIKHLSEMDAKNMD